MAQYLTLPVGNLHIVPDDVADQDACFAEPLAAACRIAEQQVHAHGHSEFQRKVSCSGAHGNGDLGAACLLLAVLPPMLLSSER